MSSSGLDLGESGGEQNQQLLQGATCHIADEGRGTQQAFGQLGLHGSATWFAANPVLSLMSCKEKKNENLDPPPLRFDPGCKGDIVPHCVRLPSTN